MVILLGVFLADSGDFYYSLGAPATSASPSINAIPVVSIRSRLVGLRRHSFEGKGTLS